jgi:hypothetical protein
MNNTKQCSKEESENCIEVCNELLRGEISAVDTYEQALAKFKGQGEEDKLRKIRDDHSHSVKILTQNVIGMGGFPSTDAGTWGILTKAVEAGANLLGEGASISTLLQGEEYGLGQYESALSNEDVLENCKEIIRYKLIPKQLEHISILEGINRTISSK